MNRLLVFALSTATCVLTENPVTAEESGLDSLPPWKGSRLEGTGSDPLPFVTEPAFDTIAWDNPLHMIRVPASSPERYLVLERWGTIWLLDAEGSSREIFLQLDRNRDPAKKQKNILALSAAFHPEYPQVPHVYVGWNQKSDGKGFNRLSRFTVGKGDMPKADPDSGTTLLEWESDGHNGSDIKFGRDGMLYMSSGDGSSPGDPDNVGQTTDNLLGSIIRIDVNRQSGEKRYAIPDGNPFVGVSGTRPEVFAYGLRNPWRTNFRPGTDELWLGDNGDEDWELIHKIERGANYGWSAFEGSHPFRPSNPLAGPTLELTPPLIEHPHSEMRSVIGGLWYTGKKIPALKGWYLYGCYFTGKIWGFPMDGEKPSKPVRLADTGGQIVAFAEGAEGEVFVVTLDKGIFHLEQSPKKEIPSPIPALLSETGLFESTPRHEPAEGVLPYGINVPAFWDGARRERFFAAPREEKIKVQQRPPALNKTDIDTLRTTAGLDRWQMPNKSTFFQTFFLGEGDQELKVETQISMKESGEWRFLTYRWKDDQTDAVLVPTDGETTEIHLHDRMQKWRFPSRAECVVCHTQRSMFVLGFNFGQLNREFDYSSLGGKPANQIDTFHHLGFFQNHFKVPPADKMPPMPDPHDESLSLEARARSYLHVNCAHCHRETGVGGRANFELLHWLTAEQMGVVGARPLVGLPGIDPTTAKLIAPGEPLRSEIYRRMVAEEIGKMPLLGGHEIDRAGAELIRKWIASMVK